MCSHAKIFTKNGRKGRLKAVMQKYSQEIVGSRAKIFMSRHPKGQDPRDKILPWVVRKYSFKN